MKRILYAVILVVLVGLPPLSAQVMPDRDVFEMDRSETSDGGYIFTGTNNHVIPLFVRLEFERLQGLQPDRDVPVEVVLPPGEAQELVRLERTTGRQVSFRSAAVYVRGDPDAADHDDDYLYMLPYEHGSKFRVTQGYNGSFTHYDSNQYAVDFDLAEGDPVYAARGGTVVEVKQDSRLGGASARYNEHANFVLIMHSDNTFGNYVHLQHDGALVEVGDEVEAGDLIGLSGNTGQSSGPHLHFDVRVPTRSGTMQSIPVQFRDHEGSAVTLEEGRYYYARHPDGGDFPVKFGVDLRNSDFADHEQRVRSGELSMRVEEIDSTYVLFLQNGTEKRLEIETELRLQGMEATTPTAITRTLDPHTEIFLSILRPRSGVNRFQYGYSFRYREAE